ncbi:MAG: helix-turn-helix transcriptional regulator [Bacteroidia bacterium]
MEKLEEIEHRLRNIETLLLSQKTVFTFDEVAIYTGLSKSYLYKLTSTGRIPCSKPNGKQIFFEKAQIDAWLLRNKCKTAEEIESEAATHVTLNRNK